VEAASIVAVVGSVLATALPSFVRNLQASRLVEPIDGLNRIASRATALAAGRPPAAAYPPPAPLTPEVVPKGQRVTDAPGTWNHPTWQELKFELTVPHSYSFAFESENAPDQARFVATAHGDLDGDGLLSTFQITGHSVAGKEPGLLPMEIDREVE
jgi:hypothetical protein